MLAVAALPCSGAECRLLPGAKDLQARELDDCKVCAVNGSLLLRYVEPLLAELPGLRFFDAHTHTGSNDPDGVTCTAEELIDGLELVGARAVVFTSHEPDGYRAANDRVIEVYLGR